MKTYADYDLVKLWGYKSLFVDEIAANALLFPVWKRIHNSELCIDNILQRKAQ